MAVREFVAFCQRCPHLQPQRPARDAESVDDEMEEDRAWEEAEAEVNEHTWDDDDAWVVVDMGTDDFLLLHTVDEKVVVVVVDTCGDSGVLGNVMIVWEAVVEVVLEICVVNVPVFALPVVRWSMMMILDWYDDSEDSKYCDVWKFVQYIY
jgi:hypothetical protein